MRHLYYQENVYKLPTHFAALITANATLLFWPPDKLTTGRRERSPLTPNFPSCPRYVSADKPVPPRINAHIMNSKYNGILKF